MPRAFTALLFDLDGVLIDSEPLHEEAKRIAFGRLGLTVPADVYVTFKGRPDAEVVAHVVATYGGGGFDVDAVIAAKQEAYRALAAHLPAVPGALELLAWCRPHYRMALTTSAAPMNQRLAFERFALAPFFDAVVTAADTTRPKPDPQPYLLAAQRLGVDPAACLVIEDSLHGVHAGTGAGCTVAALTTSFAADELAAAGADAVFDGIAALQAWLEAA